MTDGTGGADEADAAAGVGHGDRRDPADSDAPGGASRYVDTEGIYEFLVDRLGRPGEWALSPHDAGLGNETLFLVWGRREFVVRRPPLGDAPAGFHDLLREFRLLDLLDGTDLPTPRPVAACADESVAGTPFTVQERRGGDVLRHGEPASYATGAFRDHLGTELVETLAGLHALDPDDLSASAARGEAGSAGRSPDDTRWTNDDLERTPADLVAAWRERFDRVRSETDRPVPGVERVADRLAANAPDSTGRTVVHGDYTLANVQCSRETPPAVVGLLDWERGGVGDPLVDLGWLLAFWYDDPDEAVLPDAVVPGFTARPGYPARGALRDRYERITGRSVQHDRFYRALAVFAQAAVCESYYLRHLRGVTDRPPFAALDDAVPALVERARTILDGDEPL